MKLVVTIQVLRIIIINVGNKLVMVHSVPAIRNCPCKICFANGYSVGIVCALGQKYVRYVQIVET